MPIYKRCSMCGKRVRSGTECICVKRLMKRRYKEYDQLRDKQVKRFYSSSDWQTIGRQAINRYNQLDIISYYRDKQLVYGQTVHHIDPVKNSWSRRLDVNNLIYVTEQHHKQIHKAMEEGNEQVVKEYLFSLVRQWHEEMR